MRGGHGESCGECEQEPTRHRGRAAPRARGASAHAPGRERLQGARTGLGGGARVRRRLCTASGATCSVRVYRIIRAKVSAAVSGLLSRPSHSCQLRIPRRARRARPRAQGGYFGLSSIRPLPIYSIELSRGPEPLSCALVLPLRSPRGHSRHNPRIRILDRTSGRSIPLSGYVKYLGDRTTCAVWAPQNTPIAALCDLCYM